MDCSDPITVIKTKLQSYPRLQFEECESTICVFPAKKDGFPVSFTNGDSEYVVSFGGWHEHFTDVESALQCFEFGINGHARVKVYSRYHTEYKWILEYNKDGEWVEDSVTGIMFFPFWFRRYVKYRQNNMAD